MQLTDAVNLSTHDEGECSPLSGMDLSGFEGPVLERRIAAA
jgi:hypothetical protein